MASGSPPKSLPGGRPERYEFDDSEIASPPHYTFLKAFDASHIFSKNPHKYNKLIAQEEGYTQDSLSDTEVDVCKNKVSAISLDQGKRHCRSNSLTSLDVIGLESKMEGLASQSVSPGMDDPSAPQRADSMYRRCSLDHMADYYTRRSSDAAVSAIWEPSNPSQWQSSADPTEKTEVTVYKPSKIRAQTFGEHTLTDIMMKAAFKDPVDLPKKDEEDREPSQDKQAQSKDEKAGTGTRVNTRRMSLPETVKDFHSSSLSEEGSARVSTVQPQARRLFGIGPLYNPLPETVVEDVVLKDRPLVDLVKKEVLGADSEKASKKATKKKPPTKAEINTLAPFSM